MGYNNNQFPVFLSMKTDGTLEATLRNFEEFAVGSMGRVARSAQQAGSISGGAFNFSGARTNLREFEEGVDRIKSKLAQSRTDPFGISSALGKSQSPDVLGYLPAQLAAERKLGEERLRTVDLVNKAEASLDQQRQAALRDQMAGTQRAFEQVMRGISAQQAAIANARADVAGVAGRRSIDSTLATHGVGGYGNGDGAARASAAVFEEAAKAQDQFVTSLNRGFGAIGKAMAGLQGLANEERNVAAAADLLAAINLRTGASLTGLGSSARESASVFTAAFAEEERAAREASLGIVRAMEQVSIAARAQAQEQARVAAEAAENQRKLVSGREFIQAPGFNPQAATAAAGAARSHAQALDQVARAAENVALQSGKATATDVAFAAEMRNAANAAGIEAARLDELAATQGRVATAAKGLNTDTLTLSTSQRGSRQATLQASQQFQDFFIQVQGGQNPMVAFTQQASQLAFVMANTGGQAGKFASFIAGGWGTAIFIGLAALTPFVSKLFEGEKATKKAKDATDLHKMSIEQFIEAVKTENETLGKANQASRDSEEASLLAALAKEGEAKNRLKNAGAMLAEARAQGLIGQAVAGGSETAAAIANTQDQRVAELQTRIDELTKALSTTRVNVGRALVPLANRRDEEARDPRKKVLGDYERALTAARNTMDDEITKGTAVNVARDHYAAALRTARDAQDKANKALDKQEEAARKAAAAADRLTTANEREASRRATYVQFGSPIPGAATGSGFGPRRAPALPGGGHGSSYHKGLDLLAPNGTNVGAPAVGTVEAIGFDPGLGKYVIINHGGGTKTRYGHLSSVSTVEGARLDKGQVFAQTGATGRTQGGHLHYEVLEGGKQVDPRKGRFKTDEFAVAESSSRASEAAANAATRAAEKATAEQARLAGVAQTASDRVAGISAQFDRQPRLIDQANTAMLKLNDVTRDAAKAAADYDVLIQKLKTDKPAGFEDTVATLEAAKSALGTVVKDAETARGVVREGMVRPLEDMVLQSAKQAEIDALVLAGREDQADVLREILALEEQMGPLTTLQAAAVEKTVTAERMRKRALEENEKVIQRAVQSANVLQDALTGIIKDPFDPKAWKSGLKSVMADFKDAFAQNLSKSLFGNLGQEMEDAMRMKSDPLGAAGQELNTSALELHRSAIELIRAAAEISKNAATPVSPTPGEAATTPTAYMGVGAAATGGPLGTALTGIGRAFGGGIGSLFDTFGSISNAIGNQTQATSQNVTVASSSEELARRTLDLQKKSALMSDPVTYYNMLGSSVGKSIDKTLGTGDFFGKVGGKLGDALQGAAIGSQAAGILQLFGMKANKGTGIGSQIGGALGGAIAGPLGSIVGGILGGLVGGLLGKPKAKKGVSTIGSDQYGNLDPGEATGNKTTFKQASGKAANSAIETLERLATQLGITMNAAAGAVSIGVRDNKYRVDPTGQGRTKGNGVIDFGDDAEGAIEAAIINLIEDGVLAGIKAGTKKLLTTSRDFSKGVEKALKFESVFTRLKEIEDPVGAAIDKLDLEFNELRRIFAEAGASAAELADLERLYALDRAEAVKNAAKDATSVLKQLFEDLTFKGDFGLSLRTRRSNAEAALAPFQQQIASGQAVDQEGFSEAARALLDVERQLYGSTSQYFETLNMITELTRTAIAAGGGSVTVPGITPTLVRPAAPGTPAPTSLTSGTPGVSTASPGGSSAYNPTLTPTQTAANENYTMGQMVVAAIKEQTAAITPLISQVSIASAIQTAFVNMTSRQNGDGDTVYSAKAIGQQVLVSNGQVVGKLNELVGYASETAEATNGVRIAVSKSDGLPDNHWSKNMGGNTPNIYTGLRTGAGGGFTLGGSSEPAQRIGMSVSGF